MEHLGYHLRFRLESDRLLHCSPDQRRGLVRAVYGTTEEWPVLAWGFTGVHGHLAALVTYAEAGELGRRIEISLQRRHGYGSPFLKIHRKPLEDQHHVFRACLYDMKQREHHGLAADPYLEATSVPDLLGARILGAPLIARAREHLPELRRSHLLRILDIDDLREADEWASPEELAGAAKACFTLRSMEGLAVSVRQARHALVAVAGQDLPAPELADICCCGRRTISRLRSTPAPARHVRALRRQLDLRARVRARDAKDGLEE